MPNLINTNTLTELRETLGESFFADVVRVFLQEAPALVHTMHTALAAGKHNEFTRAAHSLKSNAATLGMSELATASLALEFMPIDDALKAEESLGRIASQLKDASTDLLSLVPDLAIPLHP